MISFIKANLFCKDWCPLSFLNHQRIYHFPHTINLAHPSGVVNSDGSESKFFDPGRVSHLWLGSEFGKFPLKIPIFLYLSFWVKKNLIGSGQKVPGSEPGRSLIYCGSKVCSSRVGSWPISR